MAREHPIGTDVFSIVVVGRMNPLIHHPAWYFANQWITESEKESALADDGTICIPPMTQFKTDSFSIACEETKWTIQSGGIANWERVLNIAVNVFTKLGETPIAAFGFNVESHRHVNVDDVAEWLASLVQRLPLGLPAPQSEARSTAKLVWGSSTGRVAQNIKIDPSPRDKSAVFISINCHHRVATDGTFQHFDLEPLLREAAKIDIPEARDRLESIVQTLSGTVEKSNGRK